MERKLTLQDKIILHLAEHGDWLPSYALSKTNTKWGWIGSSGERRARELAENGTHTLNGVVYTIEKRHEGKYAEYRIVSSKPKPRSIFVPVERKGERVMVERIIG